MRKTLNLKLLFSILLLSISGNCSPGKANDSGTVISNDKYSAVQNMLTFVNESLDCGNLQNLCSPKFAELFIKALAVRSVSEKSRNNIDKSLKRVFKTDKNSKNIIDDLKEISEGIKDETSVLQVFLMRHNSTHKGNTNDEEYKKHFLKLGLSFKSQGLEYALIFFNDNTAKIFLSDSSSANNFLIDEQGKVLDQKKWKESMSTLNNNFQCIVVPILHLELKSDSNFFVHLGGFPWQTQYALPLFISLVGAQIYDLKNKNIGNVNLKSNDPQGNEIISERKVYLYVNEEDQRSWSDANIGFSHFLQSIRTSKNHNILNGMLSFIVSGINFIKHGNDYIVFSLEPYTGNVNFEGPHKFEDLLHTIENTQEQFTLAQSIKDDIFCRMFALAKSKAESVKEIKDKIKDDEEKIEVLQNKAGGLTPEEQADLDNKKNDVENQNAELQKAPHFTDTVLGITRLFATGNDIQNQTIEWKAGEGDFKFKIDTFEKSDIGISYQLTPECKMEKIK